MFYSFSRLNSDMPVLVCRSGIFLYKLYSRGGTDMQEIKILVGDIIDRAYRYEDKKGNARSIE